LGVVIAALAAWMPALPALGDGLIIIERPPMPIIRPGLPPRAAHFPLEVKKHNVECSIRDTVGVTRVDQVFHNPNAHILEGTYMFPLPETAAVQKFSMWMNGKEVHGELLDAEKARATYEEIVRNMRDPALLEYVGSRLYKARVFPIPANGDVRIALEYTETIAVNDGLAVYRYPLNTEKFSAKDLEDVSIVVDLRSELSLRNIYCPSHNATVSRKGDREARIGFEAHMVKPDQDFIIHYQMSRKDFGLSVVSYRPAGEDGYFMARIAPPFDAPAGKTIPKNVSFVFDTSGSMAGDKIMQAKRAMSFCLSSLRPEDHFNVISFATETRLFRDSLVPANRQNVEAAKEEVERVVAAGGTDIHSALREAVKAGTAADKDRPYMIVFMTDGEPTVGERVPEVIQANVKNLNKGRCRLFVFGVGHNLNAKLLDRLADDNRGAREYIDEKEDIEVKVSGFFKKVADPVLSDIELRFGGAEVGEVYPKELPDLFHGGEMVVLGRYRRAGKHDVVIHGKRGKDTVVWEYPSAFADGTTSNDFLPRLWATRKIGYLMDEIRLHGENRELKEEIVRLAKRYAIITPYTSYLVIEDEKEITIAGGRSRGANALLPELLDRSRRTNEKARSEIDAAESFSRASSGRFAVDASKEALAMRSASPAGETGGTYGGFGFDAGGKTEVFALMIPAGAGEKEAGSSPVRLIGSKTFYRDGERWVDSEYDGKAETQKVKAFSDAYFKLLRDKADLGKYLALGSRLVVVLSGTAYEVTE